MGKARGKTRCCHDGNGVFLKKDENGLNQDGLPDDRDTIYEN